MAYDSARNRVVLFGGHGGNSGGGYLSDTWELDGKNWTQIKPTTSPPYRYSHAMTYDAARQRVVLFGGYTHLVPFDLSDTWEWDGKNWTQAKPTTSPPARHSSAMVYDSARQRVVLFGGYDSVNTGPGILGDTWEWDGKNWTQIKPTTSPPARGALAMAYDAARQRVVLFGGGDGRGYLTDTWEWDGKNWTQIKPTTSPSARRHHAMAFDSARNRVVLFGGYHSSGYLADTWEWDGKNWTQAKPTTSPSARYSHAMAYDSRGRTVLFGGYLHSTGYLGDTWEYGLGRVTASATPYGATCGPTLAPATNSRPIIGTKFTLNSTGFATTANIGLMTVGASRSWYHGIPLPIRLDFLGMKGCYLHTSFDVTWSFPVSNGTGPFSINVPNSPALLASKAYLQSVAGTKSTNGVEIVVGNR